MEVDDVTRLGIVKLAAVAILVPGLIKVTARWLLLLMELLSCVIPDASGPRCDEQDFTPTTATEVFSINLQFSLTCER